MQGTTASAKRRPSGTPSESSRLQHELQVHQLELEVQNRQLREANGVLEESRAQYGRLYDRAPTAHLTFDARGRIQAANLSAGRLLATPAHRLIGQYFRMFLSLPSRRTFDTILARSFAADSETRGRVRVRRASGARVVDLVLAPFRESAAEARVCHAAALDVTLRAEETRRRAKLLRTAREARALAEQASAMKEHFLAVVSHELRTPLGPMLMWLAVLQGPRAAIDPALRERAIVAITGCVRDQVAMIDDLVDTARAANGKLHLDRNPVDLAALVMGVIERSTISAAAKGVKIDYQLASSTCLVSGDVDRLRQVVGNVLSNALKFSGPGGQVDVSVRSGTASVYLVVRDEGEGITADLLPLLFEPFRQRETGRARRHGGLGLGLSIARGIVALHGGEIRAESPGAGRGATFTIVLPRIADDHVAGDAPLPSSSRFQTEGAGSVLLGVSVLVVDDHAPTREALAATLERQGARIALAASAAQGRAALSAAVPDVLISDLSMPGEDGYAFIRGLRDAQGPTPGSRHLPALALTAQAGTKERDLALHAGFDQYLVKPIDPIQLVSSVAELARSSRMTRS